MGLKCNYSRGTTPGAFPVAQVPPKSCQVGAGVEEQHHEDPQGAFPVGPTPLGNVDGPS